MDKEKIIKTNIKDHELDLLKQLRDLRHTRKRPTEQQIPLGDRIADGFALMIGSWKFIIIQTVLLFLWIVLNVTAYIEKWDPYPFILLNLLLSFQAAYAGPIIMMSQNRQSMIDRNAALNDYNVNLKAELEIELLHQKIDMLREKEMSDLVNIIDKLQLRLTELNNSGKFVEKDNKETIA